MRRTQIYIDEHADAELRQAAAAEGRSAAALIREALTSYLEARARERSPDDPILAMAGTLHGLPADAAVEHDRDLYVRRVRKRQIARKR
jgi:hypothetical protein